MLLPKKSKDKIQVIAFAAMLTSAVIWGIAPAVIKTTLDYLPPFTFLFYRFLLVCIILLPFMYLELRRQSPALKDLPSLLLIGLLGQTSLSLLFIGLKYTTALEASAIGIIAPLLLVACGHYFFGDRVNKRLEAGLIVASVGTVLLTLSPLFGSNELLVNKELKILGNLLVLLYQLLYVGYVLWSKRLRGENSHGINIIAKFFKVPIPRKRYGSFFITGFSFYVALACMLPFFVLENNGLLGGYPVSLLDLGPKPLIGLLYMALCSSIVAYGLYEWALKYLRVTDTVVFSYLAPLVTVPAAFILLGELPTIELIFGSLIIAVGIVIAEQKKS